MPALFKNNATATLAASINTTATTIVLNAGLGNSFPLPSGTSFFYGTLFDSVGNYEIVKCTARTVDSLTVVRGQDGTNPLEFISGDGFAVRPIAAVFNNFPQLDANNTLTGNNTFSGANTFSGSSNTFTQNVSVQGVLTAVTEPVGTINTRVATTAFVASSNFPSGTRMTFNQTAAPTGWTKDTSVDNAVLRLTSGTITSGGSIDFTTLFATSSVVPAGSVSITSVSGSAEATTLTTPQIPSHTHTSTVQGGFVDRGGGPGGGPSANLGDTGATGGGGSHTHPFSFSSGSATFSGTALNLAVKYVDLIIAQKN